MLHLFSFSSSSPSSLERPQFRNLPFAKKGRKERATKREGKRVLEGKKKEKRRRRQERNGRLISFGSLDWMGERRGKRERERKGREREHSE